MQPFALALIVYSVQLLIIVAVAAAAAAVLPLTVPSARLAYWRSVGVLCLLVPLLAPFGPEAPVASVMFRPIGAALVPTVLGGTPLAAGLGEAVVWIYVAGVTVRLAWLLAGAVRLRMILARSVATTLGPELDALRLAIAPRAECRRSVELGQPVTCGLTRPVVLLPPRFDALSAEAQRAVAYHELLHVSRGDWAWIVVEEHLRAVFWFHPAAWWLLEQVQLSREQLIDRTVVARTSSRRAYMEALLAFADSGRVASLSPAFLRRRHLESRLRLLSKEPHMSRRRTICTMMVLTLASVGTAATVAIALPLDLPVLNAAWARQAPVSGKAFGVTMPVVLRSVNPSYTPAAMAARIEGDVIMEVVVEDDGSVGNVVITKSLDAVHGLDDEAIEAIKQWEFRPGRRDDKPVAVAVTVEMTFTLK